MIDLKRRVLLTLLIGFFCAPNVCAVSAGMTDTFDNDAQSWGFGGGPFGPVSTELAHTSTGVDESFVTIESTGIVGPQGKPTTLNRVRWAGGYIAEGIAGITMDVNRLMLGVDDDNIDMELKLFLANTGFSLLAVTTASVTVSAGSVGNRSIFL